MRAAFYTLGCKVNQYETQLMLENLRSNGYQIVSHEDNADVYIVNSCTVTAMSNSKTRQAVRGFKKKNPNAIVVLAGCMSQAYPKLGEELKEADIIIGNTEHKNLAKIIKKKLNSQSRIIEISEHAKEEKFESGIIHNFDEKTRAIVKIEDGCNRFCSYCAIPYARGRVRSKPIADIKTEVKALSGQGFKEIVLVGINLSAYDDNGKNIADAVKTASEESSVLRVRLGSLEPDHITDDIMESLSNVEKFCPQFHISLQSGCNKTLKAMNRHYTAEEYLKLCEKLRATFDNCALTTDVMVGFPNESEQDFTDSYNFVKTIGFEKIHVFPYSVREGTVAAKMSGQIEKRTKNERCKKMIALGEEMRESYFKSLIGKNVNVLFEKKHDDGFYFGYTTNYTPVKILSNEDLQDKIISVKIVSYDKEHCIGE